MNVDEKLREYFRENLRERAAENGPEKDVRNVQASA
ncbi:MAG: hypothetical protein ACI9LV_000092 [Candidatus Nanohaloarchaea archaeon]|jgi:hypothetical protein